MPRQEESIGSLVAPLLRAFAARPRNWLVLARNMVPVVGVFAFGWSSRIVLLDYWVDGFLLLALFFAAVFIRGAKVVDPAKYNNSIVNLVFQLVIGYALMFGLTSIPFWMVWMELDLAVPLWQVSEDRLLTIGMAAVVVANFVGSFLPGGYFRITMDEFRKIANSELYLLVFRGMAMLMISSWTKSVMLVPLFALAMTFFETWPQMRQDLSARAPAAPPA